MYIYTQNKYIHTCIPYHIIHAYIHRSSQSLAFLTMPYHIFNVYLNLICKRNSGSREVTHVCLIITFLARGTVVADAVNKLLSNIK